MDTVKLTLDEVHALAERVLAANGADAANASAIAANMTAAERDGSASHGLFRLPGHVTSLLNGKANGRARPRLERLSDVLLRVHGERGFAPLAQAAGLPALAEAARAHGLAALAITRAIHYAALWHETEWLAERGLAALACTSSPPYVAPHGGTVPIFGTNPISFAWPRPEGVGGPAVVDMATAAMSRGEIGVALRDGHALPEGVGLDAGGQPTTDPEAILKGGVQLAFGGHKGAAIALMVDLLAGPLIGEVTSLECGAEDNKDGSAGIGGEFILALDPSRFGGEAAQGERLFTAYLDTGARLPGQRRHANRARAEAAGAVAVPTALHERILALG